ncbi:phosphonate ABC transporter ATP-binding protein [Breoghania sp. L-A4]|uniref:phosphonate ABC transporter ATP-binding protein n=1 Tax=Breoghania sp. L-A4 TaxID=2304600 RepID=UPI000E35B8C3|nr:phosphonate ABC transporter ATP-binding protein [Breoghania sp. L-A4]AXS42389.1 phosphonate ABC transporter ATP-binding protein [Breoghania sp. L-A4]
MTAVKIDALSKSFGRKLAVNDVSLTIPAGEMVALIGASGSGKSTLIRHIAGLERGDAGTISIAGQTIQVNGRLSGEAREIRRQIGVVFQQFNLVNRLSVLTNVLIGFLGQISTFRGTFGMFTGSEKQAAMRALARVGIADTARQRASTLSGGQKQRAAIARALVQGAKLMLADEPIASLDPASAKRVMEILAGINREDGLTIVVSLHQVEYARRYCPRAIAMKDGGIVYDGPSVALTNDFLKELYGEASEELILPDAPVSDAPASGQPVYRPAIVTASGAQALATA